jgi:hypothetical protein
MTTKCLAVIYLKYFTLVVVCQTIVTAHFICEALNQESHSYAAQSSWLKIVYFKSVMSRAQS